jgi:hypothetical protein
VLPTPLQPASKAAAANALDAYGASLELLIQMLLFLFTKVPLQLDFLRDALVPLFNSLRIVRSY